GHVMEPGLERQPQVRGVGPPQAGAVGRGHEAVAARGAEVAASGRVAAPAVLAPPAREEALDRDPGALLPAPRGGGPFAQGDDAPDGLVAGDEGVGAREGALVLFEVGAAQAGGL